MFQLDSVPCGFLRRLLSSMLNCTYRFMKIHVIISLIPTPVGVVVIAAIVMTIARFSIRVGLVVVGVVAAVVRCIIVVVHRCLEVNVIVVVHWFWIWTWHVMSIVIGVVIVIFVGTCKKIFGCAILRAGFPLCRQNSKRAMMHLHNSG